MFFQSRRAKNENHELPNYWMSFTDFALSLLISFILLSTLMIVREGQEQERLNQKLDKITSNFDVRVNIAKSLKDEFKSELETGKIENISDTGAITLGEQVVEFKANSSELISGADFIDNFFPRYIKTLKESTSPDNTINYFNDGYIQRIIIEGHVNKVDTFTINSMSLSQDRAFTVYSRIYSMIVNDNSLNQKVQAVGRGPFECYGDCNNANANRRVEFHFTLDEEKIAEEQLKVMKEI